MNDSLYITPEEHMEDTLFQTVTFSLEQQLFAINILNIRDIVMSKTIYRIPNSNRNLLGVTNLRGEIIPVYSLAEILNNFSEAPSSQSGKIHLHEDTYFLILKVEKTLFALSVENIHKNIRVTNNNYNPSQYFEKWSKNTIFIGTIIEEEQNILLLDVPKLLNILSLD